MAAYVFPRRYRRGRYLRRRGGSPAVPVVIIVAVLAAGASAKTATAGHRHSPAPASPRLTAAGPGEAGFFTAVLADLGAPATAANLGSLAAWASHEGPWGSVGQWNPLDTILPEPGSWAFNSFGNGLHVQSYPSAATGAQATAATIGGYPHITASLRSGAGLCGTSLTGELLTWSGGGYGKVC
jgi:hypothetical protein